MKAVFNIILFLIVPKLLICQIYFNNNYENNSNISNATAVIELDTDGYVFPSCVFGSGYSSLVILRVNLVGDTLWTKEYRRAHSSFSTGASNSIIKTKDNKYIFSGSLADSSNNTNALLVKINENGDTLWTKTYGGSNFDNANIVSQTPDSGFVLMGVTQSFSHGSASDFYLIKTDKNGNFQWQNAYGTTLAENCLSGQITLDGGFIMSGDQNNEFYIVKTDSAGNMQWQQTYHGTSGGCFIKQLADSSYILTGAKVITGFAGEGFMIKINKTGGVIWQKHYGSATVNDWFYTRPIILNDESIVIGGQQMLGSHPIGMLVKTDSAGNQQWLRTYYKNASSDNYFYDLRHTNDNGFVMSGFAFILSSDPWLVKVDSNGCEIAGCNVGVEEIKEEENINIYPNPANDLINIDIEGIADLKEATLIIYDLMGREIIKEKIITNKKEINIANLKNGLYFIQVQTDDSVNSSTGSAGSQQVKIISRKFVKE